jgi:hypothetical protein
MADASRRPSEEAARESKEAHTERYKSKGTGSGTWLDKYARNIGLPDSMQKNVDESPLKRGVLAPPGTPAENAAHTAKMRTYGYAGAGIMILGSVSMVLGMYMRSRAPARRASLTAQEALRAIELRQQGVLQPSAAQLKGKEEELAALEARWQELRTRHYERHPLLYRDE